MKTFVRLIVLVALLFLPPLTHAQTHLTTSVIAAGGGSAANSSYQLSATVGQPAVGLSSNASYTHTAGFWPQVSLDLKNASVARLESGNPQRGPPGSSRGTRRLPPSSNCLSPGLDSPTPEQC